jgi:hypothetical protein
VGMGSKSKRSTGGTEQWKASISRVTSTPMAPGADGVYQSKFMGGIKIRSQTTQYTII